MSAEVLLERLERAYQPRRDPDRARAMAAYMRHHFPFLGIPSPERAEAYREATAGLPPPSEAEVVAFARACWQRPEREYAYAAVTHLRRHVRRCSADLITTAEELITHRSWWDTVDELAHHVVGPLVAAHPRLRSVMEEWVGAEDFWLARTAILHQGRYRERTDAALLFAFCLRRAGDREFFLRKAIGWALRDYARVDPEAVRRFVTEHDAQLSGLSKREALKHLGGWPPSGEDTRAAGAA